MLAFDEGNESERERTDEEKDEERKIRVDTNAMLYELCRKTKQSDQGESGLTCHKRAIMTNSSNT